MVNLDAVEDSVEPFAMDKVEKTLGIMNNDKACKPTGIVKKHLVVFLDGKLAMLQIAKLIFTKNICFTD